MIKKKREEGIAMVADYKTIGENVKKARERAGISVEEMAEFLGISKAYYMRIEAGTSAPRVPHLFGVCQATNTSLNTLFGYQKREQPLKSAFWMNCTTDEGNLPQ